MTETRHDNEHEPFAVCDGDGPEGHPRVYLAPDRAGRAVCPYCSRVFQGRSGDERG